MTSKNLYCDALAGELIYFYDRENLVAAKLIDILQSPESDEFGRQYLFESHITVTQNLREKISKIGLKADERFSLEIYKISVPEGQEVFKINWLYHIYHLYYQWLENKAEDFKPVFNCLFKIFGITTNSIYSLSANTGLPDKQYAFTDIHHKNLALLNYHKKLPVLASKKILVIDSGISNACSVKIKEKRNFIAPDNSQDNVNNVEDMLGHGTFVTEIINNVCPKNDFTVYKIVNDENFATEWDLLAALLAYSEADIINLSLSYGLKTIPCGKCGRLTSSSRSVVLDFVITHLTSNNKIIVAAAGNESRNELSYPARFSNVLAILSINTSSSLSDFSNYSTLDHFKNHHSNVFTMPGGNQTPEESIFKSDFSSPSYGTSFAAAYAAGFVAHFWSAYPDHTSGELIEMIKKYFVKQDFYGFNKETHGNGIMQY